MKEIKVWLYFTSNSFQQTLTNKLIAGIFLLGKFLRIGLFVVFLSFLFQGSRAIGGYSREQIIFFYLSFNLVDTTAQLFFREVYRFRSLVVSGNLDFVLIKPINPLLRVLLGGGDVLDLIVLVLVTLITVWFGITHITTNLVSWILYLMLIINGLLIAASFHIFVLAMGITTTSVDHLIMVYRDLTSLLRIPVDLYIDPIRTMLTFIIPLGVMLTFPAKVLMGLLSPTFILVSIGVSIIFFYLSLNFWKVCLRQYQSASS